MFPVKQWRFSMMGFKACNLVNACNKLSDLVCRNRFSSLNGRSRYHELIYQRLLRVQFVKRTIYATTHYTPHSSVSRETIAGNR